MAWHSTAPDGAQSVKSNRTILQDNTTYIENTVGTDHFWDVGANLDGHHQFVQTQNTNTDDSSLQTNPQLATEMNLVYYSRQKTASESVTQQDSQPYVKNIAGTGPYYNEGVMQLLGIRACALFNVATNNAITVLYQHNITSITRSNEGIFLATYADDLPSPDYLVLGGAIGASNQETEFALPAATTTDPTIKKAEGTLNFNTYEQGTTTALDPLQCWFVCFGG